MKAGRETPSQGWGLGENGPPTLPEGRPAHPRQTRRNGSGKAGDTRALPLDLRQGRWRPGEGDRRRPTAVRAQGGHHGRG